MIRRIVTSLGFSSIILLVTMLSQIISVPILLTHWGVQLYGEWLTLTNLISSLTIINFGVQTYVLNILIAHYERGEIEQGTQTLHAALRLYVVFCGASLSIVLMLVLLPSLRNWLNIEALSAVEIRFIIFIQGLLITYMILDGLLMVLLIVIKQYPRRLRYALVERIIILFTPLGVAFLGGFPTVSVLITGLFMAGIAFIEVRDVSRRTPFPLGFSNATWRISFSLIVPSLVFFAVSLAAQVESIGIILVISTSAGAATVALFSTTLMLTNFVRTIINQGMNVLWPEITAASTAADALLRLQRWHRLVVKLVSSFALAACAAIALFGVDILTLWTRGEVEVDSVLNLLLVLYLTAHAPALASRVFGLATNRQDQLFRVDLITAILKVLLALIIFPSWGVKGVALALLFVQTFNTLWVTKLACTWTGDRWQDFLWAWLGNGVVTIIAVVASVKIIAVSTPHLLMRILILLVVLVGCAWIAWRTWYTSEERLLGERLVQSFKKRFRRLVVKERFNV